MFKNKLWKSCQLQLCQFMKYEEDGHCTQTLCQRLKQYQVSASKWESLLTRA